MEEYTREPCPWRIVDDCGGAFTMGLIGGGVFQSIKGFRNAPSGINKRLVRCLICTCKVYFFHKRVISTVFCPTVYSLPPKKNINL